MMKNTYHEEIRHANHIFRLDVTCARARSIAEANPSLNALRLDSLHSNVRRHLSAITFMETKLKLV